MKALSSVISFLLPPMPVFFRLLALAGLLLVPIEAGAQDIPATIPDGDDDSTPREGQRRGLRERHHETISRLHTTIDASLMPALGRGDATVGFQIGIGYEDDQGGSLFALVGYERQGTDGVSGTGGQTPGAVADDTVDDVGLLLAGYDLPLARLGTRARWAERTSLRAGVGFMSGRTEAFVFDLAPRYRLAVRDWWTAVVGVRLTQGLAGDDVRTFVGPTAGIRIRFRERRELR
jgi:hypothetical protein